MLRALCFSKDRPLQLEAFIESLMHYTGLEASDISVVYTSSAGITYDTLIARHPDVDWVVETDFQRDLKAVLAKVEGYVLLGCDDVVFKDYFDLNTPIRTLQNDPDIFGFSLRLGTNIRFVPDVEESGDILLWDWRQARNEYWRYAWEVSASVYRAEFVRDYLERRDDLTNPNRFEAYLARDIAADPGIVPPKLACFPTSRCVTVTMNRVQDEFPNDFDDSAETDPKDLFENYRSGLHYDWPKLFRWNNKAVHTGSEAFHMAPTVTPPEKSYVAGGGAPKAAPRTVRLLRARILFWRVMIAVWERARRYLPESVLKAVRKIANRRSAP